MCLNKTSHRNLSQMKVVDLPVILNDRQIKGKIVSVLNYLMTTPWRRMGEWIYRSTFSWSRHCLEVNGELHAPAALPPWETPEPVWTIELTLWSWALLERPPVVRPLDSFPAFHGTRRFNTKFTRALYLFLSWARPIHSISPIPPLQDPS
jgi:hypothetical protein